MLGIFLLDELVDFSFLCEDMELSQPSPRCHHLLLCGGHPQLPSCPLCDRQVYPVVARSTLW